MKLATILGGIRTVLAAAVFGANIFDELNAVGARQAKIDNGQIWIEFWRKLMRAEIDVARSITALGKFVADATRPKREVGSLPERMEEGLRRFGGR